jgi:hypothetical protein
MTFTEVRAAHGVRSWRVVRGYEKLYRVTSCGRVWSLTHNKFIRQSYNVSTYLRVELWRPGFGREWRFVHRLVAEHYKRSARLPNQTQVNHIDWNHLNNNADNLEFVSPSENCIHAKRKNSDIWKYLGGGRWYRRSYEEQKQFSGAPF